MGKNIEYIIEYIEEEKKNESDYSSWKWNAF